MLEDWSIIAREENQENKDRIAELYKASLSPEEQYARERAEPLIAEVEQKYESDGTANKVVFVKWLNDTHVPEEKRKAFPNEEETGVKKKFARWCVRSMTKPLHSDNYIGDVYKVYLHSEIMRVFNKVVNHLKGH